MANNILIKRFMRGVFVNRPALPRYNITWNVSIVLSFLKTMSPNENLTLTLLTKTLVVLLLLLFGQRGQTVHMIDIRNIFVTKDYLRITFGDLLKNTRPSFHLVQVQYPQFNDDRTICPVITLEHYMLRTK